MSKDDIEFRERVCAHCGNKFIVCCPIRQYAFKIYVSANKTLYYCRWSHFKKGKEYRDQLKQSNREAYAKRISERRL